MEEPTDDATLIAEIPPDDWKCVLQYEAHADVLTAAEKHGAEGVRSLLQNLRDSGICDRVSYAVWRN